MCARRFFKFVYIHACAIFLRLLFQNYYYVSVPNIFLLSRTQAMTGIAVTDEVTSLFNDFKLKRTE